MADEERRAARRHPVIFLVNIVLSQGVQGGGGFVQGENGPVFIKGPGQHQPLGLPAGELYPVLEHLTAQLGIQPLGQRLHRFGQARLGKAGPYPVRIDALHPLGHVFRHAGFQQGKILEHRREKGIVIPPVEVPDVLAVEEHPPLGRVQEAAGQPHQGGFARAVEPHDGQFFPGVDGQVDIVEGIFIRFGVAVTHMVKADLAGHGRVPGQRLAAREPERFRPVQRFPDAGNFQRLAVERSPLVQDAAHPLGETADRREVEQKPGGGQPFGGSLR